MQHSNKHISCVLKKTCYIAQYTLSIESNQTETYSMMPQCHGHVPVFDDQDLMAERATSFDYVTTADPYTVKPIKNIPRPYFL